MERQGGRRPFRAPIQLDCQPAADRRPSSSPDRHVDIDANQLPPAPARNQTHKYQRKHWWLYVPAFLFVLAAVLVVVVVVILLRYGAWTAPLPRQPVSDGMPDEAFPLPEIPDLLLRLDVAGVQCQMRRLQPFLQRADPLATRELPTLASLGAVEMVLSSLAELRAELVKDLSPALALYQSTAVWLLSLDESRCAPSTQQRISDLTKESDGRRAQLSSHRRTLETRMNSRLDELDRIASQFCRGVGSIMIYHSRGKQPKRKVEETKDAFASFRGVCLTITEGLREWKGCRNGGVTEAAHTCHGRLPGGGIVQVIDQAITDLDAQTGQMHDATSSCGYFSRWMGF